MDISNDRERRFELEERWLIAHDLCGLLDQVCNFVGRKVDGRTRLLCGHHGVRSDSKISCEKGCHLSVGRPNGPTWRRGALSAADLSFSIMASTLAASAMDDSRPVCRLPPGGRRPQCMRSQSCLIGKLVLIRTRCFVVGQVIQCMRTIYSILKGEGVQRAVNAVTPSRHSPGVSNVAALEVEAIPNRSPVGRCVFSSATCILERRLHALAATSFLAQVPRRHLG